MLNIALSLEVSIHAAKTISRQPNSKQAKPFLRKLMSIKDAVIMKVLSQMSSDSNLSGDFSQNFCCRASRAAKAISIQHQGHAKAHAERVRFSLLLSSCQSVYPNNYKFYI